LGLRQKRSDREERVSCSYRSALRLTELSAERYLTRLIGRTDIDDALKRLDKLTNEEVRMATALILKATRNIDDNQLRENLRKWLSPPDPSKNHNIACALRHEGSAKWLFEGSIFNDWKSTGSLLWIHGKRAHISPSSRQHLTVRCCGL
jgi:hypothetical protein